MYCCRVKDHLYEYCGVMYLITIMLLYSYYLNNLCTACNTNDQLISGNSISGSTHARLSFHPWDTPCNTGIDPC